MHGRGFSMDILEAIAEKEKQIEQLRKEINTLQSAAKILEGATGEKAKSQPDMAAAILEQAGKPLHVTQIIGHMQKRFKKAPKANTLGVTLYRYAKRGSRFYKVKGKPNTYGLIKWQTPEDHMEHAKEFKVAS
jgi:hypothetical protein